MKLLLLFFFFLPVFAGYSQPKFDTLSVYFAHNSSQLLSAERGKISTLLKDSPRIIAIDAHCDTTGSDEFNKELAENRIQTVLKLIAPIQPNRQNVFGEQVSKRSTQYDARLYRKVDIIYWNRKKPVLNISSDPHIQAFSEATLDFIKDKTQDTLSLDLAIYFHASTPLPKAESYDDLKALLQFMKSHPNINADIHGHVCCGDFFILSHERAKLVYNHLVHNRIPSSRLNFKGHSNKQPKVFPEVTEDDRQQNRRVNVVFTKK